MGRVRQREKEKRERGRGREDYTLSKVKHEAKRLFGKVQRPIKLMLTKMKDPLKDHLISYGFSAFDCPFLHLLSSKSL